MNLQLTLSTFRLRDVHNLTAADTIAMLSEIKIVFKRHCISRK